MELAASVVISLRVPCLRVPLRVASDFFCVWCVRGCSCVGAAENTCIPACSVQKGGRTARAGLITSIGRSKLLPPQHTRARTHVPRAPGKAGTISHIHYTHAYTHACTRTHAHTHAHTHTHTRTHVRCHHYRCHCHSRLAHCVHLPWCPQAMQRCATLTTSAVLQHKQQPKQPPQASGYMEGYVYLARCLLILK